MHGVNHFNLAEQLLVERRIEESLAAFNQAEKEGHDPDLCSAGRWTCLMLIGRFEQAWQESDLISGRCNPDGNRFWDGRDVSGNRILIRCLHGLGDTLQFVRYATLLRARGCQVVIEAQPTLKGLLDFSGLATNVITWHEPEPPYDQQIEVIELPRIFRTTLCSIPAQVPYLFAPEPGISYSHRGALRVALVWGSGTYDPTRSIPLARMAQLCAVPDVDFYSLQADPERKQLLACPARIYDAFEISGSVIAATRTLQAMDLVITVDTMMAHLAGALGRPVWTLLPYRADWRWMLGRDDSPWYPTMRLFRQHSPGDWENVIKRVRETLQQTVHALADVAGDAAVRGSAAPGSVK